MSEITLKMFLNTLNESMKNEKRFCFILGSGASRGSGIPTGVELARQWVKELNEQYSLKEVKELQVKLGVKDITPTSENYFDIYKLRFYPDYHNGTAYLEKIMEKAEPSLGYYPLSRFLTETENNLVITTNFDSLVEDALFIYTRQKPIVASHEALAEYINISTKRPIVAKIHRGLFFEPLNNSEDLKELSMQWKMVLRKAFQIFVPVVIGYAGGDHTLMDFLKDDALALQGLYWCCRDACSDEIRELVEKQNGHIVSIEGFDEMMFLLGNLFDYNNPEDEIRKVADTRIQNYNKQLKEFSDKNSSREHPSEAVEEINRKIKEAQDLEEQKLLNLILMAPKAENYARLAGFYADKNKRQLAIENYTKAIQMDPTHSSYYAKRGALFSYLNKREEALRDLSEAINLNPMDDDSLWGRGKVYTWMNQKQKALADFDRVLELNPMDAICLSNRGELLMKMERYEDAISNYTRMLEIDGENWITFSYRGEAYLKSGNPEKAIQDYTSVLSLSPNQASYYYSRGELYEKVGDQENAIADFSTFLELNPGMKYHYLDQTPCYIEAKQRVEKGVS